MATAEADKPAVWHYINTGRSAILSIGRSLGLMGKAAIFGGPP